VVIIQTIVIVSTLVLNLLRSDNNWLLIFDHLVMRDLLSSSGGFSVNFSILIITFPKRLVDVGLIVLHILVYHSDILSKFVDGLLLLGCLLGHILCLQIWICVSMLLNRSHGGCLTAFWSHPPHSAHLLNLVRIVRWLIEILSTFLGFLAHVLLLLS
jgi:hypothetical protein